MENILCCNIMGNNKGNILRDNEATDEEVMEPRKLMAKMRVECICLLGCLEEFRARYGRPMFLWIELGICNTCGVTIRK
jgi:hypothetical protein